MARLLGWLASLFAGKQDAALESPVSEEGAGVQSQADEVKSPEGGQRSPEVKLLANNLIELSQVLALRSSSDRAKASVESIFEGDKLNSQLQSYYADGGFIDKANRVDMQALLQEVDELVASKFREGSLSEYEAQAVLIQLGFLGVPSQLLTDLIGNKEFAIAASAEDIPWIIGFRKALPSVKLALVINESERSTFEKEVTKNDPEIKLWTQNEGDLFETKTDENGYTARTVKLALFEAGIATGLNASEVSSEELESLLSNIAIGFRGGITFDADGLASNSLLDQVEKIILDTLFQGARMQIRLNDFIELARKLAIQA